MQTNIKKFQQWCQKRNFSFSSNRLSYIIKISAYKDHSTFQSWWILKKIPTKKIFFMVLFVAVIFVLVLFVVVIFIFIVVFFVAIIIIIIIQQEFSILYHSESRGRHKQRENTPKNSIFIIFQKKIIIKSCTPK